MPALIQGVKTLTTQLYDDKTRPDLVAKGLVTIGAERVLPAAGVDYVASLSTYSGLVEKGSELYTLAKPYLEKAKEAEGRKELLSEGYELASEKLIKPAKEMAAEKYASDAVQSKITAIDTKLVQPTKSVVAPYIQKLSAKKEAILSDKRVEKALGGIKTVREHPQEVVADLKAKAVNLIKYDDLASYREYIQSSEFQEDTRRLVQVQLPALATEAAATGKAKLSAAATTFSTEFEVKKSALASVIKRGYEWGKTAEYDELRTAAVDLISELQTQIAAGVVQVKNGDLTFSDIINKVTQAYLAFGVDTPSLTESAVAPAEAEATTEAAPKPAEEEKESDTSSSSGEDEVVD